jgi:hypothetical protein
MRMQGSELRNHNRVRCVRQRIGVKRSSSSLDASPGRMALDAADKLGLLGNASPA